ncbi:MULTISPECIES: aspartate aminotransferase family protein [Streptomyces]|uniref:Acetylornithine/acetyl-lysine aminotransferase n=2 Tax=Streptomyces TaxID=1883 RepID=A0A1D8G9N4_9ACTN|nr:MULTISPECIES: aspartate aminotransferase family protein [Streptomyces]AOT62152.1 Acetylornithine/acetyl-lysine aminotransferase [Streptomyces rubrolavendulae]KAF0648253.1 aminotransferase [Streptomyces fradiae ATCC 10745 = DSM 40063]OSY53313.1 Acetylornithine/acetyl-lysine aminotransferase [Streptomyces fradiae ATCC 10745 = DSM 40063]QEV15008.1 aspartate aminotransferase family protein [Streptomyces fradiae ATCC 10745 = DSM 40063]UQS29835.1 aspartate aminotransferase family protein [Strepto
MTTDFDLGKLLADRASERYELHARHLNHQLPRMLHTIGFDKVYERAEGARFWDAEGNEYLDMLAGFGVMGLGRHHPVVRRALHDVLDLDLPDLTRFDCAPLPGLLAERLLAHSPHLDRVYFGNSGAEAVETALKFARRATGRPRVLYCAHAFHGLTTGALSVNGEDCFRDGFAPLLPDTAVELGDLDALDRELRRGDVAALIVEPIQGKGVHEAPPGFLRAAQELLHKRGALLVADEVQTGLGRTGDFYAYQHEEGVEPDLVCVAKALSGGYVPVSATIGKDWIFKKVYSSMDRVVVHSASFGANAQAMAAGLAVLAVLEDEDVVGNARRTGALLKSRLAALTDRYEMLREVRGRGLMIGIEFGRPSSLGLRGRWTMLQTARRGLFAQMVVVPLLQRHRILTQVSGDRLEVIKLIPPLVIGEADVDRFVTAFTDVMDEAHSGGGLIWDFGRTLVKQAVANR